MAVGCSRVFKATSVNNGLLVTCQLTSSHSYLDREYLGRNTNIWANSDLV